MLNPLRLDIGLETLRLLPFSHEIASRLVF